MLLESSKNQHRQHFHHSVRLFFRNICLTKLTNENGTTKNILKQFTPNCQQDSWTKAKPDAMQYARKPNQPQPCYHPLIDDKL